MMDRRRSPDSSPGTGDRSVFDATSLDGTSLPGWIYRDAEFLQAEKARIFAASWQIVCHLSDIPRPGDYHTLDFLGEPLVVVRDRHGGVNAFFNVCRHRAARLLDGSAGHCAGRIVCPYHAWTYDLGGALNAVPLSREFAEFSLASYSLKRVESEVYKGFVFVRLQAGLPGVADMLAPYEDELVAYRLEELQPLGRLTCAFATSIGRTSPTTIPTACISTSRTPA